MFLGTCSLPDFSTTGPFSRFSDTQTEHSVDDDLICQIEVDKYTLGIDLSENKIKVMNKETFKKTLKEKLQSKALEFLIKSKEKHSKTSDLKTYKL